VAKEILKAGDAPVPYEVIVLSQGGGGRKSRFILTEKRLNTQRKDCCQFNALGKDPTTGKRISLAPNTIVELARPII
jgi:hypothetical protein